MENIKNYVISANIDEKMNQIVLEIKEKIRIGMYEIKDWDSFVETAFLILDKILENGLTPLMLDTFIESFSRNEKTSFDA